MGTVQAHSRLLQMPSEPQAPQQVYFCSFVTFSKLL